MTANSKIEWTDSTWNPVRGCSIVSKGCTNCYAMKQAHRFSGPGKPYEGLTTLTKGGPVWTGKVRMLHELLDTPLRWATPRRIFVNSMSDLFHEGVDDQFIADVFAYMAYARQHTFQVLTKRPGRMRALLASEEFADLYEDSCGIAASDAEEILGRRGEFSPLARKTDDIRAFDPALPLDNVWLGVSVEDQPTADERIPLLLSTPASVRFLSIEPMVGPVDLTSIQTAQGETWNALDRQEASDAATEGGCAAAIDWVICGGEAGPGARPMDADWARSLRDQCNAAAVPFFFKQWGEYLPVETEVTAGDGTHVFPDDGCGDLPEGRVTIVQAHDREFAKVGKKAAGRRLDGWTWDEVPS